jgi:hypothetical protein
MEVTPADRGRRGESAIELIAEAIDKIDTLGIYAQHATPQTIRDFARANRRRLERVLDLMHADADDGK